jgi:regulator of nucleoside diphosphate kinase
MQDNTKAWRKPNIKISKADYTRLSALAGAVATRNPDASDGLFAELERARVVADGSVPVDVVQMGSTATFKPDTGDAMTVTLVFPGDADISEGKISILTPIGTALIGLSTGQSIMWTARDGRRHELSILAVKRPTREGDGISRGRPAFSAISAGA